MIVKDEHDLVYGLKANDVKHQKTLVDRYAGILLRIVMLRGLSREDGLEVVNDTFYKVLKNISKFDVSRGTKFSAWLMRIAINNAIDKWRQEQKSPIKGSIEERGDKGIQDSESLWQSTDIPESQICRLSKNLLKTALKNLNETDQKILLERAYGLQYKQIGVLVNKKENAVKVAHHRALKRLKEEYIRLLESSEDNGAAEAIKAYS